MRFDTASDEVQLHPGTAWPSEYIKIKKSSGGTR